MVHDEFTHSVFLDFIVVNLAVNAFDRSIILAQFINISIKLIIIIHIIDLLFLLFFDFLPNLSQPSIFRFFICFFFQETFVLI
jgi:hypothetical protein